MAFIECTIECQTYITILTGQYKTSNSGHSKGRHEELTVQSCLLLALLVLSQDGPEMEKVNIQKASRFCRKS